MLVFVVLMIELAVHNGTSRYLKFGDQMLCSEDMMLIQCEDEADADSISKHGCSPTLIEQRRSLHGASCDTQVLLCLRTYGSIFAENPLLPACPAELS